MKTKPITIKNGKRIYTGTVKENCKHCKGRGFVGTLTTGLRLGCSCLKVKEVKGLDKIVNILKESTNNKLTGKQYEVKQ